MHDKYEQRICYYTDGRGKWWKVTWAKQCGVGSILYGECQGVDGHSGCHWNYRKDGSYAYWRNEDDPASIEDEDVACGSTPPGNESYVHPEKKAAEYFMRDHSEEEIVDPELISRLENDDAPEPNATIDRPASPEDIEELRALGRIPES